MGWFEREWWKYWEVLLFVEVTPDEGGTNFDRGLRCEGQTTEHQCPSECLQSLSVRGRAF